MVHWRTKLKTQYAVTCHRQNSTPRMLQSHGFDWQQTPAAGLFPACEEKHSVHVSSPTLTPPSALGKGRITIKDPPEWAAAVPRSKARFPAGTNNPKPCQDRKRQRSAAWPVSAPTWAPSNPELRAAFHKGVGVWEEKQEKEEITLPASFPQPPATGLINGRSVSSWHSAPRTQPSNVLSNVA